MDRPKIVDPHAFRWRHSRWTVPCRADPLRAARRHVHTRRDLRGARQRLPDLRDLGVTAIELMPVADFPGARNWGYDGVGLFAPSRATARPTTCAPWSMRAHALGLAVMLDVVYNHLGPEGAYLPQFYPDYFTDRHSTPWGGGINLDGPGRATCGTSSSTTRCSGCTSIGSTACGSTPRTRSIDDEPDAHRARSSRQRCAQRADGR